jgi:hypothetical protein
MRKITKCIQDNLPLGWKLNLKPPKYKWTEESYMFTFMGSNCLMVLHKILKVINFLKDYFASVLLSWTYTVSVIALEPEISYIFIIDISVLSRSIATKFGWLLTSSFHKLRSHSCVAPVMIKYIVFCTRCNINIYHLSGLCRMQLYSKSLVPKVFSKDPKGCISLMANLKFIER